MSKRKQEKINLCCSCNSYICKAYNGTCRKYRIICFIKTLSSRIYNIYKYIKTIPFWRWF